jgi:hypothetical protein
MKTIIKKMLITGILTIGFSPLYAGSGHSHAPTEVSSSAIQSIAKDEVTRLVKADKIDKSWLNKKINIMEKYNKGYEWRISFKNDQIKDTTKQMLYIFVRTDGTVTAANYTGK